MTMRLLTRRVGWMSTWQNTYRFSSTASAHTSDVHVSSLKVSKPTMQALTQVLKYEHLTKVQAETLPIILDGHDVLAKSKTGTGKTMAFLIPTIETMAQTQTKRKFKPHPINALILSPARELASQIEVEANKLTTHHPLKVACFVGGVSMSKDLRRLEGEINLLVATPGRLQDHIQSNNGNLVERLAGIQILVLDEADRLLDMGFRSAIERLLTYLPKERQTLLFSATLPDSLEQIKRLALKPSYKYIDTVGDEDQTNAHVKQSYVSCAFENHIGVLDKLLHAHIEASKKDGYKIIVFFPTARAAGFMAQLFNKAGYSVLEMHSRKSQAHRTKMAAQFRARDNQIMFSSDVSARGVDYPDVTLVIQVGLTEKEQYIHRLGRTGRAGKEGEGILLLSPFEMTFLDELNDVPIQRITPPTGSPPRVSTALTLVSKNTELRKAAEQAYQAWLGYYNSNLKRIKMKKESLIDVAETYSSVIGLKELPILDERTVKKMGLLGMGLRVEKKSSSPGKKRFQSK